MLEALSVVIPAQFELIASVVVQMDAVGALQQKSVLMTSITR
jgi:hypothetical protein